MGKSPCDVRNIDSTATLSKTTISTNDRETVTANNKVVAYTSRKRMFDSANEPSSTLKDTFTH